MGRCGRKGIVFVFRRLGGGGVNTIPTFSTEPPNYKSMEHISFILHHKQWGQLSQLSDEELGKIMKAIFLYRTTGEIIEMDRLLNIIFISIREQLDYDIAKWEKTRKERSEAGKLSGEARRTKRTNVQLVKQKGTKRTVSVPVSVSVPDSDTPITNTLTTLTEQALKHDNRNQDIQTLIYHIKQFCTSRGIIYDSADDRNFSRHIMTAKDFGEIADKIGKSRIDTALSIIELAESDKFWRGKVCGPKSIYQQRAKIMNTGRATYMNQTQNPDVLVI